jgi:hypothetical protein
MPDQATTISKNESTGNAINSPVKADISLTSESIEDDLHDVDDSYDSGDSDSSDGSDSSDEQTPSSPSWPLTDEPPLLRDPVRPVPLSDALPDLPWPVSPTANHVCVYCVICYIPLLIQYESPLSLWFLRAPCNRPKTAPYAILLATRCRACRYGFFTDTPSSDGSEACTTTIDLGPQLIRHSTLYENVHVLLNRSTEICIPVCKRQTVAIQWCKILQDLPDDSQMLGLNPIVSTQKNFGREHMLSPYFSRHFI